MTEFDTIDLDLSKDGIATLRLNRPQVSNAFDDRMILEITQALAILQNNSSVRVLCLIGSGKNFCAGADLNWMKRTADCSPEENYADALRLSEMMSNLYRFSKPTVVVAHGAVFGGGVGLVACCDIVIADATTVFCLSEVRLGLVPAVISPYVVSAMGARIAKRYILTGERFSASQAYISGLVHECVAAEQIPQTRARILQELLSCGPESQQVAKAHITEHLSLSIDSETCKRTADLISKVRASDEGKEGISAFLSKRHPAWRNTETD